MSPLRRLLTHHLRPVELLVIDAFLALGATALGTYAALESARPGWLCLLTGAAVGLPLAVRRKAPLLVAAVVSVAAGAALFTGVVPGYATAGPITPVALAYYTVGLLVTVRRTLALVPAVTLTAVAAVTATDGLWNGLYTLAFAALMIVPTWLLGVVVRERRGDAARHRARVAREAATEERLRVARDLHDVIGHSLSLITVKASIAVHVAADRPQEALEALRVIEETSREALRETRELLGMLRDDDLPAAPGPADLQALAERASVGGVRVHLDIEPGVFDPVSTSDALARSVYRITQEAVTNVVKHAAPATCRAMIAMRPEGIRIEVVDDGGRVAAGGDGKAVGGMATDGIGGRALAGTAPDGTTADLAGIGSRAPDGASGTAGTGLIGMRERAGLHGGTFTAGPRPEGGFRVDVLLPHEATS